MPASSAVATRPDAYEFSVQDIEYVRHASLRLDLKIMWWTVASVLSGRGAG